MLIVSSSLWSCPRWGRIGDCHALCRATLHWQSLPWRDLLQPMCYCSSGRTQGSLVAPRIWLADFSGCGGSLRVKGPNPGMPVCSSSLSCHTPISFPLPQQLLDVWRSNCMLPAWLSAVRAWEMRSYGKTGPVEPRGMWNLGSSQIKITFIWPSAPVFVGVGISEAVELTQQLHAQRLARFPPSCVLSVSASTYHSHPGASNLHWEIRRAHLRRWCETDIGGTTAEVLLPENTGYLWKTHLSLKLHLLELGSGRDGRYSVLKPRPALNTGP